MKTGWAYSAQLNKIVTEGEKCKIQMPVQTFLLFVISAACEHLSIVLSSVLPMNMYTKYFVISAAHEHVY